MSSKVVEVERKKCDRCHVLLSESVLAKKGGNAGSSRVTRESRGAFSVRMALIANKSLKVENVISYDDVCPRCYDILAKLVEKMRPVKRGRGKRKKTSKKRK